MNKTELCRAAAREEHRAELRELCRQAELSALARELVDRYGKEKALEIFEDFKKRVGA